MSMTSRERMLAAMRNEAVDHVPCGPFGIARLDIESPLVQDLIRKTDIFLPGPVGGSPLLGKHAGVETVTDGNETLQTIKTPKGSLVRRTRRTEVASATVEYPLKTLEDIDKLLSVDYEEPDIDTDRYFDMKKKYDREGLVLAGLSNAVCVPADWFGPENFCLFWATAREEIVRLTNTVNERVCRFVRKCCEAGVTDFRLIGGEFVSEQIGPAGMDDLIRRPDKEVIDTIHEYDGIAFYHNHGRMMAFLEDYAHIGVDFLEPMEAPPWGDTHLGKAKAVVGDRFCMVGNLDDMEIVDKLDTDEVTAIARQRIEEAGVRGFILSGTASGTYTEKGARNFMAMADVAREYRG
jgi:hypothetical protein